MSLSTLLIGALGLPVLGMFLIQILARYGSLMRLSIMVIPILLCLCVLWLLQKTLAGEQSISLGYQFLPGLQLGFSIEPMGIMFASVAAIVWVFNSLYTIAYMDANQEQHQARFYSFMSIAMACAMGVAFADDLLTLFICYEALTLSTYPLVAHKGDTSAVAGSRRYLQILMGSSLAFFLPAIIWTWHIAGTLTFTSGGILHDSISAGVVSALLLLYMFGIGKAALMPMHIWLPSAMVAPAPVSAFLHAVAVVKVGVYSLLKVVVGIFGIEFLATQFARHYLLAVASMTIIIASVIALHADNLKRRLAYSTISQLAYVVMATAILLPISINGAMLHIAAHAFGKITLFLSVGAIYTMSKKTAVSQLKGIGWRMPWTMFAFSVGCLSMIGVPPTGGFLSKWYILSAAISVEQWWVVSVVIVSTLLNASYFLPIIYTAFCRPDTHLSAGHADAPWPMRIAILATASLTIGLFFWPVIYMQLMQGINY